MLVSVLLVCSCEGGAPVVGDAGDVVEVDVPQDLHFRRTAPGRGEFTWEPVDGADSYEVLVDDAVVSETDEPSAEADIVAGPVEARVVAKAGTSRSDASPPFPVLFDIRARACDVDFAEVTWRTTDRADTAVSFDVPNPVGGGDEDVALMGSCFDPTPTEEHGYGDAGACSVERVPAGSGGGFVEGETYELTLLSRDSLGYLGEAVVELEMPAVVCVCVCVEADGRAGGCGSTFGCAPSVDLDDEALGSEPDISLTAVETTPGVFESVTLVAPGGVVMLDDTYLCDVDDAGEVPAETEVVLLARDGSVPLEYGQLPERSTTLVVWSDQGRAFKMSLAYRTTFGVSAGGFVVVALRSAVVPSDDDGTFSR